MRTIALLAALTLSIVTLPTPGLTRPILVRGSGTTAGAIFSSTDQSGCINTQVFLNGQQNRLQTPPGAPAMSVASFITIIRFDTCTSSFSTVSGSTADADFQADGALNHATLQTTIQVCDSSSSCFDVFVDLAWTATDRPFRSIVTAHLQSPTGGLFDHFMGMFRDAQAAGTVSDGVTNFTPTPSVFAQLGDADDHVLTF